jgi:hypothetical protein
MLIVDGKNFESKRNVRKGCQKEVVLFSQSFDMLRALQSKLFFQGWKVSPERIIHDYIVQNMPIKSFPSCTHSTCAIKCNDAKLLCK